MKLGGSVLQPAVEFGGDGPVDLELWLPGQTAAGHDHIDVPQRAEVVQRVSLRDDQIGTLACRDRSGHRAEPGQLCGAAGRRM